MPTSSDQRPARRDANRQLARYAISWYAVEPARVEKLLRQIQDQDDGDILHALMQANLITPAQAESLRLGHAPTQIDAGKAAPASKPAVKEPTRIGPLRILRRLGQGGMGAVYLAFEARENRQVAVKVLAADQAPRTKLLQRFQQEGRHGAMLKHPNIVHSYGADQDPETKLNYIILEFVDGPSAHDLLDRSGPLLVGDAVHIILDIARALEYAHVHHIIHRDIKPSNILLTATGVAKLSDMGLAKRCDEAHHLTNTSQGLGTPYYMPYEQAINARRADERSDIYALGATLYHLLTGIVPFEGESSLEIVEKKALGIYPPARLISPSVPDTLEDILAKMLARNPEDRYQTVSELIVDLERAQLAVTIPSFIDRQLALKDPVVRQQWAVPVAPTAPDIQLQIAGAEILPWFLRYQDRQGNLCKSKVTTAEILDRLRQGKLSAAAEAAHELNGDYKPLEKWPEFRKTVSALRQRRKNDRRQGILRAAPVARAEAEEVNERPPSYWLWIIAAVLGTMLLVLISTVCYFLLTSA